MNDNERDDEVLTPADQAIRDLYEASKESIAWDESDDAVMSFAREAVAGRAESGASESREGGSGEADSDADDNVVAFPPRKTFISRVIHSPAVGFSMAASLMIGIFAGQGLTPYVDLGVSPGYQEIADENKKLRDTLTQQPIMRTRSLDPGAAAGGAVSDVSAIAAALRSFDCSTLTATLSKDLRIVISGHVANEADLARLQEQLAPLSGPAKIENKAMVLGRPFCQPLEILQAKAVAGLDPRALPTIGPHNHGAFYRENESLVVEATATTLFDSYLYVDMVQKDGTVVHMRPIALAQESKVKAGERVLVGLDGQKFTVAPPFGTDMLVVISAPEPLFDTARPQVEKAEDYFAALRDAMAKAESRDGGQPVVSNHFFLKTGK
jgi:hypothetical protein